MNSKAGYPLLCSSCGYPEHGSISCESAVVVRQPHEQTTPDKILIEELTQRGYIVLKPDPRFVWYPR